MVLEDKVAKIKLTVAETLGFGNPLDGQAEGFVNQINKLLANFEAKYLNPEDPPGSRKVCTRRPVRT